VVCRGRREEEPAEKNSKSMRRSPRDARDRRKREATGQRGTDSRPYVLRASSKEGGLIDGEKKKHGDSAAGRKGNCFKEDTSRGQSEEETKKRTPNGLKGEENRHAHETPRWCEHKKKAHARTKQKTNLGAACVGAAPRGKMGFDRTF